MSKKINPYDTHGRHKVKNQIPDKFDIPEEVYASPLALGKYIAALRERRDYANAMVKAIKATLDQAEFAMLDVLAASGQTHFAFEELGRFAKTSSSSVSFPSAEDGGRDAALRWLKECMDAELIDFNELMSIQQARVSKEPVLALEEAVLAYNTKHPNDPLPESPFSKYTKTSLSFTKS